MSRIIRLEVAVDGVFATGYRADGLILSTHGSTATACRRAAHRVPDHGAVVLTRSARTPSQRPIGLPATQRISITLLTDQDVMLTLDGQGLRAQGARHRRGAPGLPRGRLLRVPKRLLLGAPTKFIVGRR